MNWESEFDFRVRLVFRCVRFVFLFNHMDNLTISLKLVPLDAKKRKVEVCVDKCIICDSVVDEILITSTESGRKSLITAAAKRRDESVQLFERILQ